MVSQITICRDSSIVGARDAITRSGAPLPTATSVAPATQGLSRSRADQYLARLHVGLKIGRKETIPLFKHFQHDVPGNLFWPSWTLKCIPNRGDYTSEIVKSLPWIRVHCED